jgi:hypothetical protein
MKSPYRVKAPLTLISSTLITDIRIIQVKHIFRDADGHIWQSDHIPAFVFELEYVRHEDEKE